MVSDSTGMKISHLIKLGIPGDFHAAAMAGAASAKAAGMSSGLIRRALEAVVAAPGDHLGHVHFHELAAGLATPAVALSTFPPGSTPYTQWGAGLDANSVEQMRMATRLSVAVRGALMPDAHLGYGLPIGGVLATENAVIPYAVGVDIACRVKMTVLDLPLDTLSDDVNRLQRAIESETRFGIGASFEHKRRHDVMDRDWSVSPVTKQLKDKAWKQLGTSGSGNHFVEFGELEIDDAAAGLPPGSYLALLSHSGSRGTGAKVCDYYSKKAMNRCRRDLNPKYRHLSWLDLDGEEGQEYWAAMNLMGEYAAANHACIHRHIREHLGVDAILDIENHHNFAWKEVHEGRELIVHRKGATPAGAGVLGIIPGTMATRAHIVRGKGNPASLNSAAHGAGRVMSRTRAKKTLDWRDVQRLLDDAGVTLMSAGLDEVPTVYKDIDEVMGQQADLVESLARFYPRIVKMAPAGEKPED